MNRERTPLEFKGMSIASELFEKGFPTGGGPCGCTSSCCEGGVYADCAEKDTILSRKDMIKKYMDETQSTDEQAWFERGEYADPDFPSGRCIGTSVINGKCAFLDKRGRCTLQVAAMEEGMDKWALKPLFCILYPLEISDRVVGYDPLLQGEEQCCSATSEFHIPIFRACREELSHLLGEDGYQQLEHYYESLEEHRVGRHSPVKA